MEVLETRDDGSDDKRAEKGEKSDTREVILPVYRVLYIYASLARSLAFDNQTV